MRNIIAIIAGIIIGVFFMMTGQMLNTMTFPVDQNSLNTIAGREAYMEQMPLSAQAGQIIAWAIAAFAASAITTFIQGRNSFKVPMATITVMQIFAWMNMLLIPHPTWMWVAGSLAFIIPGYLAYYALRRKPIDL